MLSYPAHTLHTTLSHLDETGSYVRLIFIDYSPEFIITKLKHLGLNTSLRFWVQDSLTS